MISNLFFFFFKLQTPNDVDKLRAIGVKTIFCLQEDPDLEYPKFFFVILFKYRVFFVL